MCRLVQIGRIFNVTWLIWQYDMRSMRERILLVELYLRLSRLWIWRTYVHTVVKYGLTKGSYLRISMLVINLFRARLTPCPFEFRNWSKKTSRFYSLAERDDRIRRGTTTLPPQAHVWPLAAPQPATTAARPRAAPATEADEIRENQA